MDRLLSRVANVAFAFVMMNVTAVAGLIAVVRGHRLWR